MASKDIQHFGKLCVYVTTSIYPVSTSRRRRILEVDTLIGSEKLALGLEATTAYKSTEIQTHE